MKHSQLKAQTRKGGFTLVEIIVVLAIAALLSSLVFASFKSVNEGNKKTSCQTNLVQIYQALRLYGQDFNGEFPSYNPHLAGEPNVATGGAVADWAPSGLGLWALYAYPKPIASGTNLDCDGRTTQLPSTEATSTNEAPLASYIKSPNSFHCPYDKFDRPAIIANTACNAATGTVLKTDVLTYTDKDNVSRFNPFYNSYQTADGEPTKATVRDAAPYSSFRAPNASRQLVYYKTSPDAINPERRTPDTTIITWCRFHRKTDRDGNTVDRASNSDNVLFMDGTVRYLPTKQQVGTVPCQDWQRIPEETIEGYSSANAGVCPK